MYTRNSIIAIIFITLFAICASCSQYKSISIDILKPAKFVLPAHQQRFLIVNRSLNENYFNFTQDTLKTFLTFKTKSSSFTMPDSTACDTVGKVLEVLINESEVLNAQVAPYQNMEVANYESLFYFTNWEEARQLCNIYDADAIISVDGFGMNVITRYIPRILRTEDGNFTMHQATLDVASKLQWKIYDPWKEKLTYKKSIKDTISWDESAFSKKKIAESIPNVKEMLVSASEYIALDFAKQIVPKWKRTQRRLLTMNDAKLDTLIAHNKWDDVLSYLNTKTDSGSKVFRSKVEYNLALAYEMNGQVDSALIHARKSQKYTFKNQTDYYIRTLEKRQKILKKLKLTAKN